MHWLCCGTLPRQAVPAETAAWYGRPPSGSVASEVLTENTVEQRIWEQLRPAIEDVQQQTAELAKYLADWEQKFEATRTSTTCRGSTGSWPTEDTAELHLAPVRNSCG